MKPFRLWLYRLATFWLPETRCFGLKAVLLRWCGAKVGGRVKICTSAIFLGNGALEIGDDVWIGAGSRICPIGKAVIVIGNSVDVGPEVVILSGTHKIDSLGCRVAGEGIAKSVEIGAGCWLCARATILPGVKMPRKTIVAAGAVVVRDVTVEGCVVAGVPARIVNRIKKEECQLCG